MFGKKEKTAAEVIAERKTATAHVMEAQASKKPTVLEILKQRRAAKMRTVKELDREIEQLDHDITYVERYPQGARVLEFIAARFSDELKQPAVAHALQDWEAS
jgi:hypothetical protein